MNEIIISKENHLENVEEKKVILENLPEEFERVDFNNPRSIIEYGHADKEAISDILKSTAHLSLNERKSILSTEMINNIYSFENELTESDKNTTKRELSILKGIKNKLTQLGIKKYIEEEKNNSYGSRYEKYCRNLEEICKYIEESMQESLNDIELRKDIIHAMKPYVEHLDLTIKVGEADYQMLLEEIDSMKNSPNKELLNDEIINKEQIAFVFNDKLDKLRKVLVAYKQQILVYTEQQHNEMILVIQQQSYIEDQQPILMSQGSNMIFNRQQQSRSKDLQLLNEATNRAYVENAKAITENTETILDLAVNGGLKTESITSLHKAIEKGISVIKEAQQKLTERIANDEKILKNVQSASEEYEKELSSINQVVEEFNNDGIQKKLGTYHANNQ